MGVRDDTELNFELSDFNQLNFEPAEFSAK